MTTQQVQNGTILSNPQTAATYYFCKYFEQKYDTDINADLYKKLNPLDWLSCIDSCDGIAVLIKLSQISNAYNTVTMTEFAKLSRQNRINISKSYDMFHNITIACIDPDDIESVTLFVKIALPKSYKLNQMDPKDFAEYIGSDLHYEMTTDPSKSDIHYIPIKKITNPTSKCIEFYKHPIFLMTNKEIAFSIQVNYHNKPGNIYNLQPGTNTVGLKYSVIQQDMRKNILETQ